jgi:hypothetical protein
LSGIKKAECYQQVETASKKVKSLVSENSKKKFFALRKKRVLTKGEYDPKKRFGNEIIKITKKPKKISDFENYETFKNRLKNHKGKNEEKSENSPKPNIINLSPEKARIMQITQEAAANDSKVMEKFENYTKILEQKYLKQTILKSLGVISKTNSEKKASKFCQELQKISNKNLIEKINEKLIEILQKKFTKNSFGKAFRPFLAIPKNHLEKCIGQQLTSFALTSNFLNCLKKELPNQKFFFPQKKFGIDQKQAKLLSGADPGE